MNDIGSISHLAGANSAQARNVGARATPPEPATVQQAVAQPLTTPQTAVTPAPAAGNAEWKRQADPDGRQQNPQPGPADRQQLTETVEHLNQRLGDYHTNLRFEMDDQYREMVVRIVDRETQEVVRQIPAEKALALAKFFAEMEVNQSRESPGDNHVSKESGRLKAEGWLLQATA